MESSGLHPPTVCLLHTCSHGPAREVQAGVLGQMG